MAKPKRNTPSASSIRRGGKSGVTPRLPPSASRDVILRAYNRARLSGVSQKDFERDALGIKNPTGRYIRLIEEGKRSGVNIEAEGRRSIGVANKVQITFRGPKGQRKSITAAITGRDITRLNLPDLRRYLLENPDVFDDAFADWERHYPSSEFDEDDWSRDNFELHHVGGLSKAKHFYFIDGADL